jgi:hypothetical protein
LPAVVVCAQQKQSVFSDVHFVGMVDDEAGLAVGT